MLNAVRELVLIRVGHKWLFAAAAALAPVRGHRSHGSKSKLRREPPCRWVRKRPEPMQLGVDHPLELWVVTLYFRSTWYYPDEGQPMPSEPDAGPNPRGDWTASYG
jgi:hypothetical protein